MMADMGVLKERFGNQIVRIRVWTEAALVRVWWCGGGAAFSNTDNWSACGVGNWDTHEELCKEKPTCYTTWVGASSNPNWTTDNLLKRIISTNCCKHTVVSPDDGPRYAWNMQRLTRFTENKLCMKVVLLYTIISRRAVNGTLKKKSWGNL